MKKQMLIIAGCGLMLSSQLFAAPFSEIRIGDVDGFGYDNDANGIANLYGDGGKADRNNDGHLTAGDVLPSLNYPNEVVATGSRDDFDNRLNESINGTGFTDTGSSGVEYTDISLSTSYDASSSANRVYDANTGTYGSGGTFPAGSSTSLSNQPGFTFDFFVADADIDSANNDMFFNMVFADYDVTPANIRFTYDDGITEILPVSAQNNGPDDGLIQAAFVVLDFDDIFTWNGLLSGWDGFLMVDFVAPNEPYTAFDYVELSTTPITVDVPEPATIGLLGLGFCGLGVARRKANASR